MRIANHQARMLCDQRPDELLAARERVCERKVGVFKISQRIEGQVGRRERVDDAGQCARRARLYAEHLGEGGGVGALAVVERGPGRELGDKERGDGMAATNDHHQRGVRLIVPGEIVERRQLEKPGEIGDKRPAAKRDHDAAVDFGGERFAPRSVFRGSDLGAEGGRHQCQHHQDPSSRRIVRHAAVLL